MGDGVRRRWRRAYGAAGSHLLLISAAFAVVAYVLDRVSGNAESPRILVWFVGAIVAHDLVAFPLYALVDRGVHLVTTRRTARIATVNHVRLPLAASALLVVVYLPGIVRQGATTYHRATGLTQQPFLARWLILSACLFGVSAVLYSVRLVVAWRRGRGGRAVTP